MKKFIIPILLITFIAISFVSSAQEYQWFETSYEFEDIKLPQNKLTDLAGEDNAMTIPAPIGNFTFYGIKYTTFRIAVDGAVTFDNSGTISGENTELPNSECQKLLIAPYWNNLNNEDTYNNVYYHKNSERAIIQWDSLQISDQDGHITMQLVVKPNENSIQFNYRTIHATNIEDTWFATVGMQNADGTEGIQLAYNNNFSDGFTIESLSSYKIMIPPAYPPEMSPASGTYTEPTDITITSIPPEATIYYTTDGTEPTIASTLYENPVTISENTELKAIAVINEYVSTSTTELYELTTTGTAVNAGNISGDWTLTGSPYFILGDVTIPDGECLTIEAGAEILFSDKHKFIIDGCINAIGTNENPILFQPGYAAEWWYGIEFNSPDGGNSSSTFDYCEFRYACAESPNTNGGAIYVNNWNDLTISNSIFENNKADNDGGAIYLDYANIIITNCSITDNYSNQSGGGICIRNSDAEISTNTISNNYTLNWGGGIYIYENSPLILNNIISDNSAIDNLSSGGGIYTAATSAIIRENQITDNWAVYEGGGVTLENSNNILFENNHVLNNQTTYSDNKQVINLKNSLETTNSNFIGIENNNYEHKIPVINPNIPHSTPQNSKGFGAGGGIYIDGGTGKIQNNHIQNNTSQYRGGGIYAASTQILINSNFFSHNYVDDYGGALVFANCGSTTSSNNTFVFNGAGNSGDALFVSGTDVDIYNSIFYFNHGDNWFGDIYADNDGSVPNFYYCSIAYGENAISGDYFGGWTYTGEFENNNENFPSFSISEDKSITGIEPYSAMINLGTPETAGLELPEYDINGNPRINDGNIDIGCFEYDGTFTANRLSGEQTGTITEGIYYVTNKIEVPNGETLTIEAGTELYFCGNFGMHVEGEFFAQGTEVHRILFTSADTTGYNSLQLYTAGGWKNIFMDNSEKAEFYYTDFEYSKNNNRLSELVENDFGGFMFAYQTSPIIKNCTFENAFSFAFGGAIAVFNAEEQGGIIENNIFRNCMTASFFHAEVVGGEGGAIFIYNSSPLVVGNLIYNNYATNYNGGYPKGGAILIANSQSDILNNTIYGNFSWNGGGVLIREFDEISMKNDLNIYNNIVWNNITNDGDYGEQFFILDATSEIDMFNNNIEGGYNDMYLPDGFNGIFTDNIEQNPQFENGYEISDNSPCKNTGFENMSSFELPEFDLAGNQRIIDNRIDIGAYENQTITSVENIENNMFTIYPNPSNGVFVVKYNATRSYRRLQVKITNLTGKIIKEYSIFNSQFSILNLEAQPTGVYFISIKTETGIYTEKLIIQ